MNALPVRRPVLSVTSALLGCAVIAAAGLLALPQRVHAAETTKANNTNTLWLGTSWVGGVAPGTADVMVWDSTVTAANTVALGGSGTVAGIKIANPGGLVTISNAAGNVLGIGASGIDMSGATQSLSILTSAAASDLRVTANQDWNVASGRTLTLFSAQNGTNIRLLGSSNIAVKGGGTVAMNVGVGDVAGTGTNTANGNGSFTGNWTISGGSKVISLRNGYNAWGQGSITLDNGTMSQTGGNWTFWNNIAVNAGGGTIYSDSSGNNRFNVLGGVISGTGALTFNAVAAMTANEGFVLTGTNTFTGPMTIGTNGTVRIGGVNALQAVGDVSPGNFGSIPSSVVITNNGRFGFGWNDVRTFANNIGGTGSVRNGTGVATPAGYVTLSGTNTYSGGTQVNSGGLIFSSTAAKPGTGTVTVAAAGAIGLGVGASPAYYTSTDIDNLFNGSPTGYTITAGAGVGLDTSAGDFTYSSNVGSVSRALFKSGGNTLTLSGNNAYTGATTVVAGTLAVSADTNLGAVPASPTAGSLKIREGAAFRATAGFTLSTNRSVAVGPTTGTGTGTIVVDAGQTLTFGGTMANNGGTGAFVKDGPGTLTLTSTGNSYTGNTVIAGGTLRISGGKLYAAGYNNTAVVTVNAGDSLVLDSFGYDQPGSLGQLADYSARRVLNGGSINVVGNSHSAGNAFQVAVGSSGTFAMATAGQTLTLTGATADDIQIGGALTVGGDGNVTVNEVITNLTGGTGSIVKTGAGTLTLAGVNTFSGATTINAGTVSIAADTGLGAAPASFTAGSLVVNGGVFAVTTGFTLSTNRGMAVGPTSGSGIGTIDVANGQTLTYGGTIANSGGTGGLTKIGSGTLALSGASTYTGPTAINAGVLQIGAGSTTGAISSSSLVSVGASGTLAINRSNALTFANPISGNGTMVKTAAGETSLTGSNAFSGLMAIQQGKLALENVNATGGAPSVDVASGATLSLGTALINGTASIASLTGSGVVDPMYGSAGNRTLSISPATTGTFSGIIRDATSGAVRTLSIVKAGPNVLALSGVSTYTGETTINGGTLRLEGSGGLSASTSLLIADVAGATFDMNGSSQTVAGLSGGGATGGAIELGSGTLTVNKASGSDIFGGIVNGTGGLVKTGAGALVLNGVNGYGGPTTITGGTLQIGGAGQLNAGTYAAAIANGGVLVFSSSANQTLAGVVGGLGAFTQSGVGAVTLTGSNTYTGDTTISSGTLEVGGAGRLGGGAYAGAITNDGSLRFTTSANQTLSGGITGNGSLVKAGGGQLALTGANTYAGATTVDGGRLVVNGQVTSSAITVNAGAILGGSGTTADVTLAGGGIVSPGNSPGLLTVTNMTWNGTSAYDWEMYDYQAGEGVGWDSIVGSGSLTVNATTASPFTINLLSLSGTSTPGPVFSWSQTTSGSFRIASFTGGITLAEPSGTWWNLNTAGFTPFDPATGAFGLALTSNDIYLVYTYTPPPLYTWTAGTGVWSGTGNWDTGSAPYGDPELSFAGAGGTSTNDITTGTGAGEISVVKGVTFTGSATGGYTLAGNAFSLGSLGVTNNSAYQQTVQNDITLAADSTLNAATAGLVFSGTIDTNGDILTVTGSGATTLSSIVTGSGSVVKLGSGTLTLQGANDYSGGTTINLGTVMVGDGATSGVLPGSVLNNGALVFDRSDDVTYAGLVSGTGGVTKVNVATLTLTANNTSTGPLTITGGTLQVGDGGTSGSLGGDVTNNSSLVFNRSDASTYAGAIGGTGAVTKTGAGALTLTGSSVYSGGTTLSAGSLRIGNDSALGTGTATLSAGALSSDGGTARSVANAMVFGGDVTLGDATNNGALAFSGPVSLGSGTRTLTVAVNVTLAGVVADGGLTKAGAATLTLTGVNTYAGDTTISSGTLALGGAGQLGGGTYAGGISNFGVLVVATSANQTLAGAIVGTGAIVKSGSGTLTLAATNLYTGDTTITGGTLAIGGAGSLGGGTYAGLIANDAAFVVATSANQTLSAAISGVGSFAKSGVGTLVLSASNSYSGGTTITGGTLQLGSGGTAGSVAGNITNDAALVFNRSDSLTYAGVISGSGALVQAGSGTVALSGASTFTGPTAINSGVLQIGAGGGTGAISGASAVTIAAGGTLAFNRTGNFDFASAVAGAGGLVKLSTNEIGLTGSNAFSGLIDIQAGKLAFNGVESVAGIPGVNVASGATLSIGAPYAGGTATISGLSGVGTVDTAFGGSNDTRTLHVAQATSGTFAGILRDASTGARVLAVVKSGAGTLSLSGVNAYTGATTINAGMLQLLGSGTLSSSTVLEIANAGGATFDLNGRLQTVAGLAGGGATGGAVQLGSGTLTVSRASGSDTFAGVVAGSGRLVKSGAGTLELTGSNSYSGGTTLSAGTLGLGSAAALGSGTVTVGGSSTLQASTALTGANAVGNAILMTNNLTVAGSNDLQLSGALTQQGANRLLTNTLPGGSTLTLGNIVLSGTDTSERRLTFTGSGNSLVSGVIASGTGAVGGVIISGGTVTFASANTYTGVTFLEGGVLSIADVAALGSGTGNAGRINFTGIGTLRYTSATSGTIANREVWSDLTTPIASTSTIDVSDPAGSLTITPTGGTRSRPFTKVGPGSLTMNGAFVTNATITLAGGTLGLNGANSYTGQTTVNDGRLVVGNASALGSSAPLAVNGGLLDLTGFSTTVGILTGSNGATITANGSGTSTLTVNSASSGTYAGRIQDGTAAVALTKSGAGALALTASNAYSGPTTLTAGTLRVGDNIALGSGTVALNGGTLSSDGATARTLANAVTVGANVTLGDATNSGLLTFTGPVSFGGATRQITTPSNVEWSGTVTGGAGGLTKAGIGTLTLGGTNSYTGVTTLTAGTLSLTGNNSLGSNLTNASSATTAVLAFGANTVFIGNSGVDSGQFYYGLLNGSGTMQLRGGSATITGTGGATFSTTANYQIFTTATTLSPTAFGLNTGASDTDRKDFAYINDNGTVLTLASLAGFGAIRNDAGGTGGQTTMRLIVVDQAIDSQFDGALVSHRSSGNANRAMSLEKRGSGSLTLAGFIGKQLSGANAGAVPVNLVANGGLLSVTNPANSTAASVDAINSSGTVTITSGTLGFSGQALINTAGSAGVAAIRMNGGVLRWNAGNTQDITAGASSRLTLVAGTTATFDTNGNDVALANALGGGAIASPVVKIGGGTLTLSGANLYTGDTAISGGTLAIGGGGSLGGGSYAGAITNDAAFVVSTSANQTLSGSIGGTGSLTKSGAGTLTLTNAANAFSGGSTISGGVLSYAAGALGTTGTVTMNGGTLRWESGNSEDISSRLAVADSTASTMDIGANNVTFATGFGGGSTGGITKTGSGTLKLVAANTFSGGLTISSGTVQVGDNGTTGSLASTGTIGGSAGATLAFLRTDTVTQGSAFGTVISGAVNVSQLGSGTLVLNGANTYTGTTRIVAGSLSIAGGLALQNSTLDLNASDSGMVAAIDQDSTIGGLTGSRHLDMLGRTLSFGNNGQSTTYSGVLSNGGLTKVGAGSLTLSGSNAYVGVTTISGGTLALSGGGDLGPSPSLDLSASGATFDISAASGNRTIAALVGAAGSAIRLGGNTLTAGDATDTAFAGVMSGSGGFTKTGAGTLTLGGASTYTGATRIQSGTVVFGLNDAIPAASAITLGSAGSMATLDIDNHALTISSLTFDGQGGTLPDAGGTVTLQNVATGTALITVLSGTANEFHPAVTLSSTTVIDVSSGASFLLHASLSGGSPLTKSGAGQFDIFGNNEAYLGAIALTGGTTRLLGGNATLGSGTTTVYTGATLDFNNRPFVGTYVLAGGTAVNISSGSTTVLIIGTTTISGTSTAADFLVTSTGSAAFDLSLTSTSAVTIDLGGRATFNQGVAGLVDAHGTSTFASSVLAGANIQVGQVGQSGATAVFAGDLAHSSLVTVNGGALATFTGTAAGSIATSGTVDLTGRVTSTGGVAVNSGGVVRLLDGAVYDAADLDNAGSVIVNRTTNLTLGAAMDGVGSLAKQGPSTLTLTGVSTYSGTTTISTGTVALSGAGSIAGPVTLAAATALDISGASGDRTIGALSGTAGSAVVLGSNTLTAGAATTTTFAGVISGSGGFAKSGGGTLGLTAPNTYAGATTVSAGTLALVGAGSVQSSSGVNLSASGATLDISGASGDRTIGALAGAAGSQVLLGGHGLTAGDATNTAFGGVISGSGGFTKAGGGILTLSDIQTFTGAARVNAGTLAIGGTNTLAAASQIFVAEGATLDATAAGLTIRGGQVLGGYGLVDGNTTALSFASGATLSPGGSVGSLDGDFTNATLTGGMTYLFEVNMANGSAGGPNGWDLFANTGAITLDASVGNQILLNIASLDGLVSGSAANFDPTYNYAWKFLVAGSGNPITYQPGWFNVNASGFQNDHPGTFYVARGDDLGGIAASGGTNELFVVYAAVPEPGTLALAGIGLAGMALAAARRRRNARHAPRSAMQARVGRRAMPVCQSDAGVP